METEFVNAYIQKQKDMLVDFLNQRIMLEARLAVVEPKLQALTEKEAQFDILQAKYNTLVEETKGLEQEILNLRKMAVNRE